MLQHRREEVATRLTRREVEVAMLYGAGNTMQHVCDMLDISYWTGRTHIRRVHKKTCTNTQIELTLWIIRNGGLNILYLLVVSASKKARR